MGGRNPLPHACRVLSGAARVPEGAGGRGRPLSGLSLKHGAGLDLSQLTHAKQAGKEFSSLSGSRL